jgi:RNA polymerase sigma factor (TIGR02999 family)
MRDFEDLLAAGGAGDGDALRQLMPLIYEDLKQLARRQRRFVPVRPGETLNTTGLVHEAFVKLVDRSAARWENRSHFFNLAARSMRHILVDAAREQSAQKRGSGERPVTLAPDESGGAVLPRIEDVLAVDAALERLATIDQRLVRLVECRYFAGLTDDEVAAALGISRRTVQRDWKRARAWLLEIMGAPPALD